MISNEEAVQRLLKKRVVLIMGHITEELLTKAKGNIVKLALESPSEITLLFDTDGGDCEPGMWFVDSVNSLPVPTRGVVMGACRSIGISIFQACRTRVATRHSRFYFHSIASTFKFSAGDKDAERIFSARLKEMRDLEDQICGYLSKRSGQTISFVRELMRKGDIDKTDVTAAEAKMFGFVDEVVDQFQLFPKSEPAP